MANADRISELYKQEIWDEDAQRRARSRVDWIVSEARGDVLDIGCSQGIVSILCARRGRRVLGVDIEADRIDYALADRAAEPPEVQARLDFRVADATALDLADETYDTVIMGEVVEHHKDASPLLAEAARVLRPDGVLVLTTPFGYFPFHDHYATFYVASLIELLAPHFSVRTLAVVDGYFRVTAVRGPMPDSERIELIERFQPLMERHFLNAEQSGRDACDRLARTERELEGARRRLADTERRLAEARYRADHAAWRLAVLRNRRSWRVCVVLAEAVRSPRRLLRLPRDLAAALRRTPRPPEPPRPAELADPAERPPEPPRSTERPPE